ncbi:MAG: hypothetical protein JRM87_05075, partial [Nitrososphaerota archaeon]|nr:hypothetical protein [Nitrososphaerota archaeon]
FRDHQAAGLVGEHDGYAGQGFLVFFRPDISIEDGGCYNLGAVFTFSFLRESLILFKSSR